MIDAVLRRPVLLEDEVDLLDSNEIVEAGELVENLARHQCGLGCANRLREQQERHRLLNLREMLPDDASIVFGQKTHVCSSWTRGV